LSFKDNSLTVQFPKSVHYPTYFFPTTNPDQEAITLQFMNVLEDFLGVTLQKISLAERWLENPAEEAKGKSLVKFLETASKSESPHKHY
jgi:hypothetical protein